MSTAEMAGVPELPWGRWGFFANKFWMGYEGTVSVLFVSTSEAETTSNYGVGVSWTHSSNRFVNSAFSRLSLMSTCLSSSYSSSPDWFRLGGRGLWVLLSIFSGPMAPAFFDHGCFSTAESTGKLLTGSKQISCRTRRSDQPVDNLPIEV